MAKLVRTSVVTETGALYASDHIVTENNAKNVYKYSDRKQTIIWSNVLIYSVIHGLGIYGLFRLTSANIYTILFAYLMYNIGVIGTMAGTHRLWAHKSYKAKWPLKLLLIIMTTIAYQKSTFEWARDHRVHHKYSETDADPHNSKRGFFYSHVGWMFLNKLPEVIEKGNTIDVSDLRNDPFVMFQHKNYWILPFTSFVVLTIIPMICWHETLLNALCINMLQYSVNINSSWSINSFAHLWGNQPYDKFIQSKENLFVSIIAHGEGWHNFHHTFPWDYRAGEFGRWNAAYWFIKFFSKIGWAYDLKTVSEEVIASRKKRTGDGDISSKVN